MSKGVTWFKMFLSFAPLINAIPSQNVGEGVKAAMQYFKTGEEPTDLQEMADAVYNMLKDSIDQAFTDCENISQMKRDAAKARWKSADAKDTGACTCMQMNAEEKRKEEKRKEEKRGEETTTTTDSTYMGEPAGGGAGGGLPPDILAYAREAARGADHPAAYERKILERIRKAGFKTIEEVRAADEDRRKDQPPRPAPYTQKKTIVTKDAQPERIGGETIV